MTDFDEVIDLALVTVDDYRLRKLYDSDQDSFKTYCDGLLIKAVPNFEKCRQSLSYNLEDRYFDSDLAHTEKAILANLWGIEWYTRDNQNFSMYRQHLQNAGSFKTHSEAQGLKEHSTYADKLREEVDRQIVAYQLEDISFYMN